jgi:putative transposase
MLRPKNSNAKNTGEWRRKVGVQLDFIRPGKPGENRLCESLNGRLRDECLNITQFTSVDHARATLATWQDDYNQHRPHGSLGRVTPYEFAARSREIGQAAAKL